jgi:hypothetical protein
LCFAEAVLGVQQGSLQPFNKCRAIQTPHFIMLTPTRNEV